MKHFDSALYGTEKLTSFSGERYNSEKATGCDCLRDWSCLKVVLDVVAKGELGTLAPGKRNFVQLAQRNLQTL